MAHERLEIVGHQPLLDQRPLRESAPDFFQRVWQFSFDHERARSSHWSILPTEFSRCSNRSRYERWPGLLLLGRPLSARCGVGCHRGADELLEGGFIDLLPSTEVNRTPRVPFQAGIE